MRCEVVAIGTELLLGQIVDTNSSWIGEQLALIGIDSHFQTKVGDNRERIVSTLQTALARSDAVICCGGLGPTQDDITRECIADVMGVGLERDSAMVDHIRKMFESRGRVMAENNVRQAEKPVGASFIPNEKGTAPGLSAEVSGTVIYAVPGVPYEMHDLMERFILPDLRTRSGETSTIVSRTLRTWGVAESTLAEMVAHRLDALDAHDAPPVTIAFLASGIEGIKVRMTAKAADLDTANNHLDTEEALLREVIGDLVFGTDDETMEHALGVALAARGWTVALIEGVSGGLASSRMVDAPGAERWFRGADILPVSGSDQHVSQADPGLAAQEVASRRGADVGVALFGPPPGAVDVSTVRIGVSLPGREPEVVDMRVPGDRARIRSFSVINALDLVRRRVHADGSPLP